MTDREKLEEKPYLIDLTRTDKDKIYNELKQARVHCAESNYFGKCIECEFNDRGFCEQLYATKRLLEHGATFKKKREYIRKSPCKCGANNRNAELNLEFGRFYYKCKKCKSRSFPCKTREEALIEWNKISEVGSGKIADNGRNP